MEVCPQKICVDLAASRSDRRSLHNFRHEDWLVGFGTLEGDAVFDRVGALEILRGRLAAVSCELLDVAVAALEAGLA